MEQCSNDVFKKRGCDLQKNECNMEKTPIKNIVYTDDKNFKLSNVKFRKGYTFGNQVQCYDVEYRYYDKHDGMLNIMFNNINLRKPYKNNYSERDILLPVYKWDMHGNFDKIINSVKNMFVDYVLQIYGECICTENLEKMRKPLKKLYMVIGNKICKIIILGSKKDNNVNSEIKTYDKFVEMSCKHPLKNYVCDPIIGFKCSVYSKYYNNLVEPENDISDKNFRYNKMAISFKPYISVMEMRHQRAICNSEIRNSNDIFMNNDTFEI